jgi:hypothetical protein
MGRKTYPEARGLLITADSGGSNGSRVRLWEVALQRMANATGLKIRVCHFPPGTSKWNKIEHRMFCHITRNWRGRPLESHEVIVNLIASTTTTTGGVSGRPTEFEVFARRDARALAYCLMGDHFHIVLQTRQPNLSRLMRRINGVYAQRYTRRHEKTGHLFQGRFKVIVVDEDAYLHAICRYVDLDPARTGMEAT